ncbi:hypothetical protein SMICM17S_05816 [Streptomyces microflavus]
MVRGAVNSVSWAAKATIKGSLDITRVGSVSLSTRWTASSSLPTEQPDDGPAGSPCARPRANLMSNSPRRVSSDRKSE